MSDLLYVEVLGGAGGDMLLAALLDAGAPPDPVAEAVSSVLGRTVEPGTAEVRRGGLRALALRLPADTRTPAPRRPLELVDAVEGARLEPPVRDRAVRVLRRLGEAEARVHGVPVEELELGELGTDDTLVDVVGFAAATHALGVERILVSSLPMPPPSEAGVHPRPAPVTLELLRGFALRLSAAGDELDEPVTPTAAAIVSALGEPAPGMPELVLDRIGYGTGTRDPSGVANVVRVLLGTTPRQGAARRLLILEANVDDLSPELVPDAIEALLSAGALDAWATPVHMKHGRPALTISALCEPFAQPEVRRAFFGATSTFGLRVHEVSRPELERRIVEVELAPQGPRIRVKVGLLEGRAVSAKPEHADVVEAAAKLNRSVRSVHEQASALAHRVLEEGPSA